MAEAFSSPFDQWIRSLLNELQSNDDDMTDFVQYLMGIVTSDSETDEEKQTAIAELLADLDLKHDHNIDNLSQQILQRWYESQNDQNYQSTTNKSRVDNADADDDVINNTLIKAMNQIESNAKQHKTSTSNKIDDVALQKHKSHVLAKYSQVSDEEFDYDDEQESSGNALFQNTNTQDVEERERKVRDAQHEAYRKQQDRNKVDANNQKQKDDERKKKAQQRAQKQERRR